MCKIKVEKKKVNVIVTIIIEYVWICLNEVLNMPQVLNMSNFWIWQNSEYGRALNKWELHRVLNMSEYALKEF